MSSFDKQSISYWARFEIVLFVCAAITLMTNTFCTYAVAQFQTSGPAAGILGAVTNFILSAGAFAWINTFLLFIPEGILGYLFFKLKEDVDERTDTARLLMLTYAGWTVFFAVSPWVVYATELPNGFLMFLRAMGIAN